MCILRDMSSESAMEHYETALSYRDMFIGLGLDSDSYLRPPALFENVWSRARADGFYLTSHCDFGQHDVHEHILQTVSTIGGYGADRIDHGLNAADSPELMSKIKDRDLGLTVCPWAYFRSQPADLVFPRIQTLYRAGVKIMIGSDDPAYMGDSWVLHNLLLVKSRCSFTDQDMTKLVQNAVSMCWAPAEVKTAISREIDQVCSKYAR